MDQRADRLAGERAGQVAGHQAIHDPDALRQLARVSRSSTTGSIGSVGSRMRISSAAQISGMNRASGLVFGSAV